MSNRIIRLKTDDGSILEEHVDFEKELLGFYKNMLTEPDDNKEEAIRQVLEHIPFLVTKEHYVSLMKPISLQEVETTVKQMVEGKSPGLDGFTINFFHHCWDMLKNEVLEVVEESRKKHWVLPALKATHLTLIPKEAEADHPGKFRPISLCNVT